MEFIYWNLEFVWDLLFEYCDLSILKHHICNIIIPLTVKNLNAVTLYTRNKAISYFQALSVNELVRIEIFSNLFQIDRLCKSFLGSLLAIPVTTWNPWWGKFNYIFFDIQVKTVPYKSKPGHEKPQYSNSQKKVFRGKKPNILLKDLESNNFFWEKWMIPEDLRKEFD